MCIESRTCLLRTLSRPGVSPDSEGGTGYSSLSLTGGSSPLARLRKYETDQRRRSLGCVRMAALV